jgi:hypothetical protein
MPVNTWKRFAEGVSLVENLTSPDTAPGPGWSTTWLKLVPVLKSVIRTGKEYKPE